MDTSKSTIDRAELIGRLREVLPPGSLLHEAEELKPYECDGLTAYREVPMIVALPQTEDEVRRVLCICFEARVPVVARGAGTGLSGGARPLANGVLLVLSRFTRILEIDPLSRTARVQPGVRNLAVSEAAAQYGLYYAPDPSSQIACSIGGNVGENAGGVHCLKYGLTVHNILKLRVLTIDGELLEIGAQALDAPGYDLLALMTGSEGMLGIITEVTVRLLPQPTHAQVILAAFDDLGNAGAAVSGVISAGIVPAGMEMMDRLAIRAVEDYLHAGYPLNAEAIVLCESDGVEEEVADEIRRVLEVFEANGPIETRVSGSEAERLKLWAGRKSAFPAFGRIKPDLYCMDGTIPRKELPHVLRRIGELSEDFGLAYANVFHAGDGNLHPSILFDANQPGELERAEKFGARILEACLAAGGTITGEHGVGIEKLDQMCLQFQPGELEIFHSVKRAFDEHGLLNPGKAIPTLNRCMEFGAMRIRRGEEKFSELPRF